MAQTDVAFNSAHATAAASIIGALDSPLRIRLVALLADADHVVHELVSATGKSQPLVSQHLRVLKDAGIVESTRRGREVTYRLALPGVLGLLADAATMSQSAKSAF